MKTSDRGCFNSCGSTIRRVRGFGWTACPEILVTLALAWILPLAFLPTEVNASVNSLGLTQSFSPNIISPGAKTRLQFAISNTNAFPVSNVSFTNSLPPSLSVSFPKNLSNECASGTVTTGGNVISVYGLNLGPNQTCSIALDVTSSYSSFNTNVINAIYSSEIGPSGPVAAAVLTITGPPAASTDGVTDITTNSALLRGTVKLYGVATQVYFQYGTNTTYGNQTLENLGGGMDTVSVSHSITGLAAAAEFHYRLVASNQLSVAYGSDYGFLTAGTGPGTGLRLGGTSYLVTPELSTFVVDETVTIELWFKANGHGTILTEHGQLPPATGWVGFPIEFRDNSDPRFSGNRQGVVIVHTANDRGGVALGPALYGTWHHVVLRYNKATLTLDGFLDGKQSSAQTGVDRTAPFESGYDLYYAIGFGGFFPPGATVPSGNVEVDEVRIWNVARTAEEIVANFQRPLTGTEHGLIGYWRLNDGADGTARDASGRGNTANLVNNYAWVVSGAAMWPREYDPVARFGNGTVRVFFTDLPGSRHTIQASTNLTNWVGIGTASAGTDGVIEFDDVGAPGFLARFYRTRAP